MWANITQDQSISKEFTLLQLHTTSTVQLQTWFQH